MNKIINYIVGWSRYHIYYRPKLHFLIRKHIREQIGVRIVSMNKECFEQGKCVKCGCSTTALQMANKSCEGNCYPDMLNKPSWKAAKKGCTFIINESKWTLEIEPYTEIPLKFIKL